MTDPMRDGDYETLAQFRYTLRRFLGFSEQAAAAIGLTGQQYQALLAIRGSSPPSLRIGQLAERLLLRPHSASELVDRLAVAGLVQRDSSDEDRRQVAVRLTPHAEAQLAQLSAVHRDELRRLRPLLGELFGRL